MTLVGARSASLLRHMNAPPGTVFGMQTEPSECWWGLQSWTGLRVDAPVRPTACAVGDVPHMLTPMTHCFVLVFWEKTETRKRASSASEGHNTPGSVFVFVGFVSSDTSVTLVNWSAQLMAWFEYKMLIISRLAVFNGFFFGFDQV